MACQWWNNRPTNAKHVEVAWKMGVRANEDEEGIVRRGASEVHNTGGHGGRKNVGSLVEMWPCGWNLLREQLMEVGAHIRMLRNLYKYCKSSVLHNVPCNVERSDTRI